MSDKKLQNEGLFGAVKNFTDAFFDGLKVNATNRALEKAKQNQLPSDLIDSMQKIEDERQRLLKIIKKYS